MPDNATTPEMLKPKDVMRRIGIGRATLHKLISENAFPNTVRIGDVRNSPFRIPASDVDAYLAARRVKPAQVGGGA